MFKQFREKRAYKKALKLAGTINKKEFDKFEDGGSISAEMAMKLIRGDKKAIKRYRQLSKDGVSHIE
jgi:hypothetical protein